MHKEAIASRRPAWQPSGCMSTWAARGQGIVPASAGLRNWGRVEQSVPVERAGELRNAG